MSYVSDGYSNCGKTGSGTPFAKTTHNGQNCGVADVNGLMWEVNTGFVRDSANTSFYILKEATRIVTLTSGTGGAGNIRRAYIKKPTNLKENYHGNLRY